MSVIQLMVTIIIVTILVTVILGVVSYAAYWLRRARRPAQPQKVESGPRFFYRYVPKTARRDDDGEPPSAETVAEEPTREPSLAHEGA